jgi:hypothetical protein
MLRTVVLLLGSMMLVGGALAARLDPRAIPVVVVGGLIVIGLLIERVFYKPLHTEAPGPGWDRTGERFVDPGTGRHVVVYFNPRTGERRYVAERQAE